MANKRDKEMCSVEHVFIKETLTRIESGVYQTGQQQTMLLRKITRLEERLSVKEEGENET